MKGEVLNMRISSELYSRVKELAKEKDISVAALIRMVLSEYAKRSKSDG